MLLQKVLDHEVTAGENETVWSNETQSVSWWRQKSCLFPQKTAPHSWNQMLCPLLEAYLETPERYQAV